MEKLETAYCAGVIDSDGCITIKRRQTQNYKKTSSGDRYSYSASVFVRQVESGAVDLLHRIFGGRINVHASSTPGGKDLNHWEVGHNAAVRCASILRPFLRIKHAQADVLVEFDAVMKNKDLRRRSYWFTWEEGEATLTAREAADQKGITLDSVYQMIYNKTLPTKRNRGRVLIPKRYWDSYETGNTAKTLPVQYKQLRIDLCQKIRRLNGPTRSHPSSGRSTLIVTE